MALLCFLQLKVCCDMILTPSLFTLLSAKVILQHIYPFEDVFNFCMV